MIENLLWDILKEESIKAEDAHSERVRCGYYRLKRDESAGLSYVRGIQHANGLVYGYSDDIIKRVRKLMRERDFWRDLRDGKRDRYNNGKTLYKDVIESEAFHNGVQHVLSIVLEHTVVEMSGK